MIKSILNWVNNKKKIKLVSAFLPIFIIIVLAIPSFTDTLQPGYFPMHDNLQIMRQLVMDKCFHDGQIPCRWSVDLGYGYGYPIFNYYPPLPYYLGEIFRIVNLPFTEIMKIIVVLNLLASGIFMYYLAKEFWGKMGGIFSAVLYIYAPYHAVDIYVRGDFNEAWALCFFPAVFLFSYKLISTNKLIYLPFLSLSISCLLLSHNPITMIFAPLTIVWILFWIISLKKLKMILWMIISGVWGLALAGFFTLPVLFEQHDAHIETLVEGYFNYLAHFATLDQLFISRFWGYGPSVLGPNDGLSFQIGYFHWIGALLSLGVIWLQRHSKAKISYMILLIFGLTVFYTFMNHERSSFIWSLIKPLEYLQFPWRFLSIVIFTCSFLAGSLVFYTKYIKTDWVKKILILLVIFAAIFFYKDNFKWREHYPTLTDQDEFSGKSWQALITASIFDYLPTSAPRPPATAADGDAQIVSGLATYKTLSKNSIEQDYQVNAETNSVFKINTFYFPGWIYKVDSVQVQINPKSDPELGLPEINLNKGVHNVQAEFTNTPIRVVGNILTVIGYITFAFVILVFCFRRKLSKTN